MADPKQENPANNEELSDDELENIAAGLGMDPGNDGDDKDNPGGGGGGGNNP